MMDLDTAIIVLSVLKLLGIACLVWWFVVMARDGTFRKLDVALREFIARMREP